MTAHQLARYLLDSCPDFPACINGWGSDEGTDREVTGACLAEDEGKLLLGHGVKTRAGWEPWGMRLPRLEGDGAAADEKLEPGVYSLFILNDGGTWEQPIFVLDQPETEEKLRRWAENRFGGFWSDGLQEDPGAPEDVVADAPHYPG